MPSIFSAIAAVAAFVSLFMPGAAFGAETISIGGTGSGLALMRQIGNSFMKQHPGVQVKVVSSLGSTGGIRAVADGKLDIAVTARAPKPDETGVDSIRLASTPLIFAVHDSVATTDISTAELEKIYAGVTESWPDGSRLRVVLRPEKETDTQILRKLSPSIDRAIGLALNRPGMLMAVTDQDNLRLAEKTPGAIALTTMAMLIAEGSSLKMLKFNGVAPSAKSLASGSYPLGRDIYIVVPKTPTPSARKFMDFLKSPVSRKILEKSQCIIRVGQ